MFSKDLILKGVKSHHSGVKGEHIKVKAKYQGVEQKPRKSWPFRGLQTHLVLPADEINLSLLNTKTTWNACYERH